MVTSDPRHGRWILPLIIAAMVVLTYTFVNSLDPTDSPTGATDPNPPFATDATSSTTTLPADLAAFMVTLDIFESQATSFINEVAQINSNWESRSITFGEARNLFLEVQSELDNWESSVTEVSGVPAELAEGHVNLVIEVSDLSPKVGDLVIGLEAPDDGTLRRTAVAEFQVEGEQVLAAIEAIRELARSGGATTTTAPDGTAPDTTDTTGTPETTGTTTGEDTDA